MHFCSDYVSNESPFGLLTCHMQICERCCAVCYSCVHRNPLQAWTIQSHRCPNNKFGIVVHNKATQSLSFHSFTIFRLDFRCLAIRQTKISVHSECTAYWKMNKKNTISEKKKQQIQWKKKLNEMKKKTTLKPGKKIAYVWNLTVIYIKFRN